MPETTRTIRFARVHHRTSATPSPSPPTSTATGAVSRSTRSRSRTPTSRSRTPTQATTARSSSRPTSPATSSRTTQRPSTVHLRCSRPRFATGAAANVNGRRSGPRDHLRLRRESVATTADPDVDGQDRRDPDPGTHHTVAHARRTVEIGIASPALATHRPTRSRSSPSTGALPARGLSVSVKDTWLEIQGTEGGTSTGLTMTVRAGRRRPTWRATRPRSASAPTRSTSTALHHRERGSDGDIGRVPDDGVRPRLRDQVVVGEHVRVHRRDHVRDLHVRADDDQHGAQLDHGAAHGRHPVVSRERSTRPRPTPTSSSRPSTSRSPARSR
jgi:hypothetical protein